ncbi:MAG TPA: CdaR family protein [Fimbriimonadaceae bacterium]|jgi:YbbR domain-containing protein
MNFLRKNLGLKLMALIISLVVWTYVESQVLIQDHVQVPFDVDPTGLPLDLTATVVGRTTVQAKGPPDIIKDIGKNMAPDLSAGKLLLIVDLSRAVPGLNTYSAVFDHRRLPYEGVTWDSPQVIVKVEEKQHKGPLPIEVDALTVPGTLALDRQATTITPSKARISGRAVDVNKVTHLVAQLQIQSNIDPNRVFHNVVVQARDAAGQDVDHVEIDPSTVDVHPVLIEASGKRDVLISVPTHGELPPGLELSSYSYKPSHTLVSGQSEDLVSIEKLDTTPINLGDIMKEGSHSFKVRIVQPKADNPISLADKFVKVTAVVKSYATKTPPTPAPTNPSVPKTTTQVIPPSVLAH